MSDWQLLETIITLIKIKRRRKLYDPAKGVMKVAGLMSGKGTNLEKIIEYQKKQEKKFGRPAYKVVVIFSDAFDSNAVSVGKKYDIPVLVRDLDAFCASRGKKKSELYLKYEFDKETVKALSPFEVDVAAYGGYMSIATKPLIDAFLGVNVHPADLSVEEHGKRKYTGSHAVRDAILAGEKYISATTHIIEEEVDYGRLLMVSKPLKVVEGDESVNQERLKEAGDWVIFPKTLEFIALGRFEEDCEGKLYFDGKAIPKGLKE